MAEKVRIDRLLVDLGLASSRERARALLMAGQVVVDEHRVDKAGTKVDADADVRVKGQDNPFASRGGLKLNGALDTLGVPCEDRVVLDVGASTGGFTDCVLQRGARRVFAVDVGHGQLAWKLVQDKRVVNIERTNVRDWEGAELNEAPGLVVMDASFISLRLLLPNVLRVAPRADVVALVKPQFEVGREQVGKGGVVRDDALREDAVQGVLACAEEIGYRLLDRTDSPVAGPKGNREIFVWLRPTAVE